MTHAGLYSNDEVERLRGEAGRLYKNVIPEDRILVVDSPLKLIHFNNGITVEEIRKSENKKKILSSYREQAEGEGKELIDIVYESSQFAKMFAAIDKFAIAAPNLQLQEILERSVQLLRQENPALIFFGLHHTAEKGFRMETIHHKDWVIGFTAIPYPQ